MRRFSKSRMVLAVAASLLQCSFIPSAFAGTLPADKPSRYQDEMQNHPAVTAQPGGGPDVMRYFNDPARDPELPPQMLVTLLRQRIKYVFVIFNENHSFDNEYGTFPGVNGIYSDGLKPRSAADTPGFTQTYTDSQRLERHGPAVPDRTGAECERRRQRRPLAHRARDKDRRGGRRAEDGRVRLRRVHTLRVEGRRQPTSPRESSSPAW